MEIYNLQIIYKIKLIFYILITDIKLFLYLTKIFMYKYTIVFIHYIDKKYKYSILK